MKSAGWIDFEYKLPYVNVNGGDAPYDYPIIVALRNDPNLMGIEYLGIKYCRGGMYFYTLLDASRATRLYREDELCHSLFVAWTAFDGCTVKP